MVERNYNKSKNNSPAVAAKRCSFVESNGKQCEITKVEAKGVCKKHYYRLYYRKKKNDGGIKSRIGEYTGKYSVKGNYDKLITRTVTCAFCHKGVLKNTITCPECGTTQGSEAKDILGFTERHKRTKKILGIDT